MFKKFFCFILLILIVVSCTNVKEDEITDVALNEVVHSVFYAPQYVAMEKGYFMEEGINITLETGWGADKSMATLLSDNADIILAGPESSIYVFAEGKEDYPVNFAQLTQRAGNFLVGREDTGFDWEDVKGKTIIGGRPGGMPEMILEYVLKQNDIEPFVDVEILTNVEYTSTAGAFTSGVGDFSAEFEPTATKLELEGKGHIVASLGEASGIIPYTSYITSKTYLENNRDTVVSFTKAINRGLDFVNTKSSKEIAEVISPQFEDLSIEELEIIVERYKNQDTWPLSPKCNLNSYNLLVEILFAGGTLEEKVNVEELINNEIVDSIVK